MPRLPRCDRPGRWFHVFNRGIARRPVFETRADVRFFLACLARAVRRGELEVHAYSVLTTHFHLLIRSPSGQLAVAMDRVMNAYVRYYNRGRRRDGSLFRGRYGARPVDSIVYRRILIRYIDRNAVQARLAAQPWLFPYCSAWHYVHPKRPRWLQTEWVDGVVARHGHVLPWLGYATVFAPKLSRCEAALVKERMVASVNREEVLDDLIDAAPPGVLSWMRRKARLADGLVPALPCVSGRTVLAVLEAEQKRRPALDHRTAKGQSRDAWPLIRAYLLRILAALTWDDVGRHLGVGGAMAGRRGRAASALVLGDPEFGEDVARLVRQVLDRAYGGRNV